MAFYSLNKYEKKKIEADFIHAYAPVCKAFNEFVFEDDCIRNSFNDTIKGWNHVSIVTREKYKSGITAVAECSFTNYGAPVIMLTGDIFEGKNGKSAFCHYYEVVAYQNGINIWKVLPYPERPERPIMPTKIASLEFPVKASSKLKIEVTVEKKKMIVRMCNRIIEAADSNIPEKFHIGITACEGENKFYEFSLIP